MVSTVMRHPCSGNRCCFERLPPRAEGGKSASVRNKKTSTRFINAPFSERSFSFSIASHGGPALSFAPDREMPPDDIARRSLSDSRAGLGDIGGGAALPVVLYHVQARYAAATAATAD
jgi:hypothetical protein